MLEECLKMVTLSSGATDFGGTILEHFSNLDAKLSTIAAKGLSRRGTSKRYLVGEDGIDFCEDLGEVRGLENKRPFKTFPGETSFNGEQCPKTVSHVYGIFLKNEIISTPQLRKKTDF